MYFCFNLVRNYGATIILFTLISKIILLPISLMVQKNSIKMVKLQPEIDEIKKLYAGDKEKIGEEQYKLFEREGYNPGIGCLPTFIQIPIVLGLIQVIYHPLQHLFRVAKDAAASLIQTVSQLLGTELTGNSAELKVIEAIQNGGVADAVRETGLLSAEPSPKDFSFRRRSAFAAEHLQPAIRSMSETLRRAAAASTGYGSPPESESANASKQA